jgi:hypothetical protein
MRAGVICSNVTENVVTKPQPSLASGAEGATMQVGAMNNYLISPSPIHFQYKPFILSSAIFSGFAIFPFGRNIQTNRIGAIGNNVSSDTSAGN